MSFAYSLEGFVDLNLSAVESKLTQLEKRVREVTSTPLNMNTSGFMRGIDEAKQAWRDLFNQEKIMRAEERAMAESNARVTAAMAREAADAEKMAWQEVIAAERLARAEEKALAESSARVRAAAAKEAAAAEKAAWQEIVIAERTARAEERAMAESNARVQVALNREVALSAKQTAASQAETKAIMQGLADAQLLNQRLISQGSAGMAKWGDDVSKRLKDAAVATNGLGNEVDRTNAFFVKMGRTVLNFAGGYLIISGLFKTIQGLKDATIGYNAILERNSVALTAMFKGNQQAAQQLLSKLEEFAIVTPFSFKDLVPLVPQLTAAKLKVDDIIPTIQALGDAASASGKDINESVHSMVGDLISLSARGKLTAMDIRNFGSHGVNIVQYLAQAYSSILPKGTKAAEMAMRDLIRQGIIPADKAIEAITKGIENDPLKAGQMEKASQTFIGALSNIGDAIDKLLGGATKGLFDQLSKSIVNFAETMRTPAFRAAATQQIAKFVAVIKLLWDTVSDAYDFISTHLPDIQTLLILIGSKQIALGILNTAAAIRMLSVTTIAASARARIALNLWIVAIMALYEVLHTETGRKILENFGEMWLNVFKEVSHAISWFVGQVTSALNKIPDAVLTATPGGAGLLALKNLLGDQSDLETFTDQWWDDNIAAFKRGFQKYVTDAIVTAGGGNSKLDAAIAAAEKDLQDALSGAGIPKFGPADLMTDDKKAKAAAKRLRADQLQDAQRFWDAMAKMVEDSTKRQIDALKGLQDQLRDFFGSLQEQFIKLGVINDPLAPFIKMFERLIDLPGAMERTIAAGEKMYNRYKGFAGNAASALDTLRGGDGNNPQYDQIPSGKSIGTGSGFGARLVEIDKEIHKQLPKFRQTCAWAVSQIYKTIGVELKTENNNWAANLVQYAQRHWKKVDAASAPPGSLLAVPSSSANSGWHVTMSRGGLNRVGSNRRAVQLGRASSNALAFVPPELQGSGLAARSFQDRVGKKAETASFGADMIASFDLTGSLSKYKALSQGWGKAVQDTEKNTARFAIQTMLAGEQGQALITQLAARLKDPRLKADLAAFNKQFGTAIKIQGGGQWGATNLMRQIGNVLDSIMNPIKGRDAVNKRIREVESKNLEALFENNPIGLLNAQRAKGDFAGALQPQLARLYGGTRKAVLADALKYTEGLTRAEAERRKGIEATLPFIKQSEVDTYGMARAQEMLAKQSDIANAPEMIRLRNTNLVEYIRLLNQQMRAEGQSYDYGKSVERAQSLAAARQELDRRNRGLAAQLPLVRNTTLTETQLNAALDQQADYYAQLYRLLGEGHSDAAAQSLATELSRREANNKALERQIALERDVRAAQLEAAAAAKAAAARSQVYRSTRYGSLAQERGLAMADAMSAIEARIGKGEFDTTTTNFLGISTTKRNYRAIWEAQQAAKQQVDTAISERIEQNRLASIFEAQNRLKDTALQLQQRELEVTGSLTEAERFRMEYLRDKERRQDTSNEMSKQELGYYEQMYDILLKMPEIEHKARIASMQDRLDAYSVPIRERDFFLRQRSVDRITDSQEKARQQQELDLDRYVTNAERILQATQDVTDQLRGIWKDAFVDIADNGFGNFFDNVLQGMRKFLVNLAAEILSSWAMKQLLSLIPGMAGYYGGLTVGAQNRSENVLQQAITPVLGGLFGGNAVAMYSPQTARNIAVAGMSAGGTSASLRGGETFVVNGNIVANTTSEVMDKARKAARQPSNASVKRSAAQLKDAGDYYR